MATGDRNYDIAKETTLQEILNRVSDSACGTFKTNSVTKNVYSTSKTYSNVVTLENSKLISLQVKGSSGLNINTMIKIDGVTVLQDSYNSTGDYFYLTRFNNGLDIVSGGSANCIALDLEGKSITIDMYTTSSNTVTVVVEYIQY